MAHKMYTVRPGDTLLNIAKWANVSYDDLMVINPQVNNPNLIYAGDTILLPSSTSRKNVITTAANDVFSDANQPLWFKIAQREVGQKEKRNNPRILEYLSTTTLDKRSKATDQTAWCAAFVNWCLIMSGQKGLNDAWALSWKRYGRDSDAKLGSIVVFSRKSANESGGHVGFFVRDLGKSVEVLGGNQSDQVCSDVFPKKGKKGSFDYELLAYRQP